MTQATKNKTYAITLAAMLAAVAVILWVRSGGVKQEIDPHLFNSYDLKAIDEVKLESPGGKVTLKYDGTRWLVNERFVADPAMIEVLFATVLQAVPKRPVALTQQDSVVRRLRESGTTVSLLTAGAPAVAFRAGGNDAKTQAWFQRADGGQPYFMTIPGYRVYVSGIFELNESGWRDKRVFAFNWRNFQSLEATFARNPADNFRVSLNDQFFTIEGLAAVDTTRLNDYLDNVSLLSVNEYVVANRLLDSLAKTSPVMTVTVLDVAKKAYTLSMFPHVDGQGRVAGLMDGSQWAMIDRRQVVAISRPRQYFATKP